MAFALSFPAGKPFKNLTPLVFRSLLLISKLNLFVASSCPFGFVPRLVSNRSSFFFFFYSLPVIWAFVTFSPSFSLRNVYNKYSVSFCCSHYYQCRCSLVWQILQFWELFGLFCQLSDTQKQKKVTTHILLEAENRIIYANSGIRRMRWKEGECGLHFFVSLKTAFMWSSWRVSCGWESSLSWDRQRYWSSSFIHSSPLNPL